MDAEGVEDTNTQHNSSVPEIEGLSIKLVIWSQDAVLNETNICARHDSWPRSQQP